jgi:multicomponent K+:H+ antiporter subunit E
MNWLPHPILSLLLLLLWLLLNNSASPGHILLGALLALLIPRFSRRFWPERLRFARPARLPGFVALVLWDILVANFRVALLVLGPRKRIRPRFVEVPLDLEGDFALTLLAGVVSLTPGTVSAEIDEERGRLLVHALSEDEPEALVQGIKHRYEAPIREIFT